MSYLPFQSTTISERHSMAHIQDLLENSGFDQVASIADRISGRRAVVAVWEGAEFRFEVDLTKVEEKAIENLSDRKRRYIEDETEEAGNILADVRAKALKVGWRLMHEHIKGLCDSIKWGVISPSQAFSGFLQLPNGTSVADQITEAIKGGKLTSSSFSSMLKIEDKS